jgi:hypothetical protein
MTGSIFLLSPSLTATTVNQGVEEMGKSNLRLGAASSEGGGLELRRGPPESEQLSLHHGSPPPSRVPSDGAVVGRHTHPQNQIDASSPRAARGAAGRGPSRTDR